jgi:hypothetical protein
MSDRGRQIERITQLLSDGLNTSLHGAPRTGKSWVADEVVRELRDRDVAVSRLDISAADCGKSVFEAMLQEVAHMVPMDGTIQQVWRDLRRVLTSRTDPLIIVLDEFDSVVRFDDALDFLRLLRELIHRPAALHCSALIVSRRSLEAIESEVRGISTLAGVCFAEYVTSLTIEDLRANWAVAKSIDDQKLRECYDWSAGHAALVCYWMSARPDLSEDGHGLDVQIGEFNRFVDHLLKAQLDHAAAQLVLGPVVDDWFLERRQLQRLGVLDADGLPSLFASHEVFRDCLRQRTQSLVSWGVLGAVEIALRGLIDERLTEALGQDWTQVAEKKYKAIARMIREASPKQEADLRRYGRSGPWLTYTYPGDLVDVIMCYWDHFSAVFVGGDKGYWKARLDAIATYRNPVAHNRVEVLGETERVQCRLYAEQILRAVATFQDDPLESLQSVAPPAR